MLILSLTYKTSLDKADEQMTPHLAWVKKAMRKAGSLPPAGKTRAPAA